jgi:hypothetical protein
LSSALPLAAAVHLVRTKSVAKIKKGAVHLNGSQAADAVFMRDLQKQDPKRFDNLTRNIRQHDPTEMSESQALTNFMLATDRNIPLRGCCRTTCARASGGSQHRAPQGRETEAPAIKGSKESKMPIPSTDGSSQAPRNTRHAGEPVPSQSSKMPF